MAAKLMLGLGGEVQTDAAIGRSEDDLELSWDAGLQYMARLHRHFALGALLGLGLRRFRVEPHQTRLSLLERYESAAHG